MIVMESYNLQCLLIIIIIKSCHQHGYHWPSLATPPNCSSLLVGPQGYIPYTHRDAVCRFELVALLYPGHVRRSIGENNLWARPWLSSSVSFIENRVLTGISCRSNYRGLVWGVGDIYLSTLSDFLYGW